MCACCVWGSKVVSQWCASLSALYSNSHYCESVHVHVEYRKILKVFACAFVHVYVWWRRSNNIHTNALDTHRLFQDMVFAYHFEPGQGGSFCCLQMRHARFAEKNALFPLLVWWNKRKVGSVPALEATSTAEFQNATWIADMNKNMDLFVFPEFPKEESGQARVCSS